MFVEFAPSVSLSREPAVLREGDTAVFSCSAAANPALVTYKWFLGGREVELQTKVHTTHLARTSPNADKMSHSVYLHI